MAQKKTQGMNRDDKMALLEKDGEISMRQQCRLLGLDRSGVYAEAAAPSALEQNICRVLDEIYTRLPFYGVRRMTLELHAKGYAVNVKRVRRLLRAMGLMAVYPKPRLSQPGSEAQKRPYLLRELNIERANQVWATDITYIPLQSGGHAYLSVVMDWWSRAILGWRLAPSLEAVHSLETLDLALAATQHRAEIMNSDQGSQYTGLEWIKRVETAGMRVSHDGRGRAMDNIMVERLWRTIKYEDVYLKDYANLAEARRGLNTYIHFYNHERRHSSLDNRTPWASFEVPK